jgi:hypothetical protein
MQLSTMALLGLLNKLPHIVYINFLITFILICNYYIDANLDCHEKNIDSYFGLPQLKSPSHIY